jgi:hypothetical protein
MKRFSICPLPAALFGLLCTGAWTRADFIPSSAAVSLSAGWSYAALPGPRIIAADHNGTGGVALTRMSLKHEKGNHGIALTTLTPFSSAQGGTPDHITRRAYRLMLFLRDDASRKATLLTFTGILNGTLSADGVNLGNTFTGRKTQAVHLGHFWYTVTVGPYGAPNGSQVGTISAQVSVRHNPEPTGLVLAGMGLAALGLASLRTRWQRRRRPLTAS